MSSEQSAGYLPGDPRYGLQGEALKDYYRNKPGAVGDLLLGQARDGGRPAHPGGRAEQLCRKFR
jgi:hypothetical protein